MPGRRCSSQREKIRARCWLLKRPTGTSDHKCASVSLVPPIGLSGAWHWKRHCHYFSSLYLKANWWMWYFEGVSTDPRRYIRVLIGLTNSYPKWKVVDRLEFQKPKDLRWVHPLAYIWMASRRLQLTGSDCQRSIRSWSAYFFYAKHKSSDTRAALKNRVKNVLTFWNIAESKRSRRGIARKWWWHCLWNNWRSLREISQGDRRTKARRQAQRLG